MTFYKVIVDGVRDPRTYEETYHEELLTEEERIKLFPSVKPSVFKKVKVSHNKTYWFFGKRFEMED